MIEMALPSKMCASRGSLLDFADLFASKLSFLLTASLQATTIATSVSSTE